MHIMCFGAGTTKENSLEFTRFPRKREKALGNRVFLHPAVMGISDALTSRTVDILWWKRKYEQNHCETNRFPASRVLSAL